MMKNFFKNLKNLITRHKILYAIVFLTLVVLVIMMYVFFNLFIGSSNKYGDRLKGIESHVVSKSEQNDLTSYLKEKAEVDEASIRVQGKIIYIHIVYNRDVSLDKAKEIAAESLTKITDANKKYYDIGYYLTQKETENKEDKGFVVTGSKNNEKDGISWIKS